MVVSSITMYNNIQHICFYNESIIVEITRRMNFIQQEWFVLNNHLYCLQGEDLQLLLALLELEGGVRGWLLDCLHLGGVALLLALDGAHLLDQQVGGGPLPSHQPRQRLGDAAPAVRGGLAQGQLGDVHQLVSGGRKVTLLPST